jgi:hypothetical protein
MCVPSGCWRRPLPLRRLASGGRLVSGWTPPPQARQPGSRIGRPRIPYWARRSLKYTLLAVLLLAAAERTAGAQLPWLQAVGVLCQLSTHLISPFAESSPLCATGALPRGGLACHDNGCNATGGVCTPAKADPDDDFNSICLCLEERTTDGGGGLLDPPIGPPPPTFHFAPAAFVTPFVYSKRVELTPSNTVDLQLQDFDATLAFFPTNDPDLYEAYFTAFDFRYTPVPLPGAAPFALEREVLDPTNLAGGLLNIATGAMHIGIFTNWLATDGTPVAQSFTRFDVQLTPTADPQVNEFSVSSSGTFEVSRIPEPTAAFLLGSGLFAVGWLTRRGGRRSARRRAQSEMRSATDPTR